MAHTSPFWHPYRAIPLATTFTEIYHNTIQETEKANNRFFQCSKLDGAWSLYLTTRRRALTRNGYA